MEPPFVVAWNRLVGPEVGGDAVYGQILARKVPIDYELFYNTRVGPGVDFN